MFKSPLIRCSICGSNKACLNVFYLSHFRDIAKHVTEFVLHGIGVLLNCVDLTRLLLLSSALAVALRRQLQPLQLSEKKTSCWGRLQSMDVHRYRQYQIIYIRQTIRGEGRLYTGYQDQEDTSIEIEPQSGKLSHISPFSIQLRLADCSKDDETSDSGNILCNFEVYILAPYRFMVRSSFM